jgi:tetratricopeptide (TPR) repeat protein
MHSNLAEAYRATGKFGDAVAHCRAALNLDANYHACRLNLSLALAAQGKTADAEAELSKVLKAEPSNGLAWTNLATILRKAGRGDEALGAARKAAQLEPANAEFLSNLGQMLVEDGDLEEALQRLENAVKIAPHLPAARNNIGNALRELGRLDEAEAHYNEALKRDPRLAITHNNLGQLNQERGNYPEAFRWYEQSLKLDPRAAKTACNYASALFEVERHAEAENLFAQAAAVDPGCAEAHVGLGGQAQRRADTAAALAHYERAEKANPKLPAVHLGRASVLSNLGKFDEAQQSLRRALRSDPQAVGAYEQLVAILRGKLDTGDRAAMQDALNLPRVRDAGRMSLHFGLGSYFDATGEYEKAYANFKPANELQHQNWTKRGLVYSADEHTQFVDRVIGAFNKQHFERTAGWGLDTDVPVFVLGLPRSGTTLIEQVLASTSRVHGADELRLARESLGTLPQAVGADVTNTDAVPLLTREAVQAVATRHLSELRKHSDSAERIIDKMPENYLHIGLILTLFPNAKIIHIQRDLRDIATSCWSIHFGQIRWANRLDDIASHFRNYRRIMAHWREVLPGRFIEVRYEAMTEDLESHARRMLEFCGLDWDDRVLEFHKTERTVRTASVAQVRQPLYKKSVERWRNYEPWLGEWYSELDAIRRAEA